MTFLLVVIWDVFILLDMISCRVIIVVHNYCVALCFTYVRKLNGSLKNGLKMVFVRLAETGHEEVFERPTD